jgi:uncharacterized protein YceK
MERIRRRMVILSFTVLLTAFSIGAAPRSATADDTNFNDEYVYATTRGVSDLHMHPALKLTLYPVTLVVDTALLPFAVIAGFVTT